MKNNLVKSGEWPGQTGMEDCEDKCGALYWGRNTHQH